MDVEENTGTVQWKGEVNFSFHKPIRPNLARCMWCYGRCEPENLCACCQEWYDFFVSMF